MLQNLNNYYKFLTIKNLNKFHFRGIIKATKYCEVRTLLLSVNNVTKSFGEKQVLKGISFTAESGKALGLLGRNGAGKTTLIRIIMGVFNSDSGSVTINDEPLNSKNVKIGYLPEERGLYPKKKITEQLVYFAELQGVDKKTAMMRVNTLLKKLELQEYKNARLDTLSKGNQQKIQLIATLITDPEIVILDEPFSGLDPVNAGLLKDIVKELIEKGCLVLFSSHQMNYIEEFCNDILIINGGETVLGGAIKDIKRSYARNIIEISTENAKEIFDFLNSQNCNFIKRIYIENSQVIVVLSDEDSKDKLMTLLSTKGNIIDGFKVKEPTLNEIFIAYTEGKI